jgi:hypothetical protein
VHNNIRSLRCSRVFHCHVESLKEQRSSLSHLQSSLPWLAPSEMVKGQGKKCSFFSLGIGMSGFMEMDGRGLRAKGSASARDLAHHGYLGHLVCWWMDRR